MSNNNKIPKKTRFVGPILLLAVSFVSLAKRMMALNKAENVERLLVIPVQTLNESVSVEPIEITPKELGFEKPPSYPDFLLAIKNSKEYQPAHYELAEALMTEDAASDLTLAMDPLILDGDEDKNMYLFLIEATSLGARLDYSCYDDRDTVPLDKKFVVENRIK